MPDRRRLLLGSAALGLSGCKVPDAATESDSLFLRVFARHEGLTRASQRTLIGDRLAHEFT